MNTALAPESRAAIIATFNSDLFSRYQRESREELIRLIRTNSAHYGNHQTELMFRGELYEYQPQPKGKRREACNMLHSSLRAEFKAYLVAENALDNEVRLTAGFLNSIGQLSDRLADWYALVPPTLHHLLSDYSCLIAGPALIDAEDFSLQHEYLLDVIKRRMLYNFIDQPEDS